MQAKPALSGLITRPTRNKLYTRWRGLVAAVERLGTQMLETRHQPSPQDTREHLAEVASALDRIVEMLDAVGHLAQAAPYDAGDGVSDAVGSPGMRGP